MEDSLITDNNTMNDAQFKSIDIYQHLRLNIQSASQNCKCKSSQVFYCIPCKITCCSQCGYDLHSKHVIVSKAECTLSKKTITDILSPITTFLSHSPRNTEMKLSKQQLIDQLDNFMQKVTKKLDIFRNEKLNQINTMHDSLTANSGIMKGKVELLKGKLFDYLEKNRKFYNIEDNDDTINTKSFVKKDKEYNLDEDNTYFLTNYDLINLCYNHAKEITNLSESIQENMKEYKDIEQRNFNEIEDAINKFVNEKSSRSTKDINNNHVIEEANIKKEKETKNISPSKIQNHNFNTGTHNENDMFNIYNHYMKTCKIIGTYTFEDILSRITKYTNQIEHFKKGIFNTYKKFGSYKEIERLAASFNRKGQKGSEGLFSSRRAEACQGKADPEKYYPKHPLITKEDVCLNNPLIIKYFSYLTMDLYGNNFRMSTKELQSSHADLMIKVNEDEEQDYGKAIEGSNEIIIYEKRTQKMNRIFLKLSKNPHGYIKFPIGCRTLLIGDKLYITGGRDESQEYSNVLIYDRKTDILKRIMDMRESRSYHSMIYNDVFETLMVLGGEDSSTVEIFDPMTNRWQLLPNLNVSRSNLLFHFDKPRGVMYAMFGQEGNIMDAKHSDIIEFLDLTEFRKGWMVLDYKNKSRIDLKTFMNIFPLNDDILLLYGGVRNRDSKKIGCLFNIPKYMVYGIDEKMMEIMRKESKNSSRLSSIVSSMSLLK